MELAKEGFIALIESISERNYHAEWYAGIERILWKEVVNDEYSGLDLLEGERIKILRLSLLTNGWPRMVKDRIEWVPLEEWIESYKNT